MNLFSPSKTLGGILGQMATTLGPSFTPPKMQTGPVGTGYDPAQSFGAGSPPKFGNFGDLLLQQSQQAQSPLGVPGKLGSDILSQVFPNLKPLGSTNPTAPTTSQPGASLGGDWSGVDQWDAQIQAASAKYGVPVNLIKAVMKLESDGDPNASGAPGVWGPMQVNSSVWGQGPWSTDPGANIDKGVQILADAYKQAGDWNDALIAYRGGWGSDGYTTGQQYLDIVNGNWSVLNNSTQGPSPGGPQLTQPGYTGATSQFSSIWGGGSAPITQEFGHGDFADNSAYAQTAYAYTAAYSLDGSLVGHAGVDVGVPHGSALYAPVAGTVQLAGGTGYYNDSDDGQYGPGTGELMIQLANGDQLILGHMSRIDLQVGQTVAPGQLVGLSGGENGAHVHVEYRRYLGPNGVCQGGYTGSCTTSGYVVVDPRQALGGSFAGATGGSPYAGTAAPTSSEGQSLSNFSQQWQQQYGR